MQIRITRERELNGYILYSRDKTRKDTFPKYFISHETNSQLFEEYKTIRAANARFNQLINL